MAKLPKIEPKGLDFIPKKDKRPLKVIINGLISQKVEVKTRVDDHSKLKFSESLLIVTEGIKQYFWERSGLIDVKEQKGNIIITIIKFILKLFGVNI